jgi:rare lipoprotein A
MKWSLLLFLFSLIFQKANCQIGFIQTGKASYYSIPFHGKKTANGEIFNMKAFTAAHQTLAFNSLVRVTDLRTNKSIVVRINDRGPFLKKRIIDLSHSAAKSLNFLNRGTIQVKLEVIGIHNKSLPKKLAFESFETGKYYNYKGIEFSPKGYSIQIGAFSNKENALKLCKKLEAKGYKSAIKILESNNTRMYRIFAGIYSTENSTTKAHKKLLKDYPNSFVYSFSH